MISGLLSLVVGLSTAHASVTNLSEKLNRVSDQTVQAFRGLEAQIGRPLLASEKAGIAKFEARANSRLRLASMGVPSGSIITRLYCVDLELTTGAGLAMARCWSNGRAYSLNTLGGVGIHISVGVLVVDVEHRPENAIEGSYNDAIGITVAAGISVAELRLNRTDSLAGAASVYGLGIGAGIVVKDDLLLVTIQALPE